MVHANPPQISPQAFGLGQLAEQHRHKMVPGAILLRITLSTMLQDQLLKLYTAEKNDQLTKRASTTYHGFLSSSCFGISLLFAQQRFPMRRTTFQSLSKTVFGQEWLSMVNKWADLFRLPGIPEYSQ
jgi:hypothetical protein